MSIEASSKKPNAVVVVHLQQECKTDEEKPCKHPARFVKNVCSVVEVCSFSRTVGFPTVWYNVK